MSARTPVQTAATGIIPDDSTLPQITSLARGLFNDPVKIYQYVKNNITYEHYFGYKKGVLMTLLDRSGNDYDQCALLAALLKASGYNSTFQIGRCYIPFGDGTGDDYVSWLGFSTNLFPGQTYTQAWQSYGFASDPLSSLIESDIIKKQIFETIQYSSFAGWPAGTFDFNADTKCVGLDRVWLAVAVNNVMYQLDPSLKRVNKISGYDVATAMGYDRAAVLTAAAGTAPNAYTVSAINTTALATKLTALTTNLVTSLQNSASPALTTDAFLGKVVLVPQINTALPTANPFYATVTGSFISIPADKTSTITLTLAPGLANQATVTLPMASLGAQRLSLTFSGNTVFIMQDDTVLLTTTTTAATIDLDCSVTFPAIPKFKKTANYRKSDLFAYALIYDYSENGQHLHMRQQILDEYIKKAKSLSGVTYDINGNLIFNSISDLNLRRQCLTETLNVMGLTWNYYTTLSNFTLGNLMQVSNLWYFRFGRMAQEEGFYVDAYCQLWGACSTTGSNLDNNTWYNVASYFESALEHGLLEQMQPAAKSVPAVSTIKVLSLANTANAVYRVDASSVNAVKPLLLNYGANFIAQMTADVTPSASNPTPATYLLPKNAKTTLGTWTGYGYVKTSNIETDTIVSIKTGAILGGGVYTQPSSIGDIPTTFYQTAPSYLDAGSSFNIVPPSNPSWNLNSSYGLDPVDMGTGSFTLSNLDLSVGEREPRGLNLLRSYNSNWNNSNPVGLGLGWTHNYNINATVRSAADSGLGTTTPYDMAAMVVAAYAAADIYRSGNTAINCLTAALISKWGIDNLRNNTVAFTLGKDSLQFIKQPSGVYQRPANSTLTLTKNASSQYVLKERLGKSYLFNATTGKIQSITDFDGKVMIFTYNTMGLLSKVTDAYSRSLTFTYDTTGKRLISASDSTLPTRFVSYGSTNGQNLTSYTDPVGKLWTMAYTNDLITSTADPDLRTIIINTYDSENRVISQLNQGLSTRQWNLYWTGFANTEQSPQGQSTVYFYDQRGRTTGVQDGLGRLSTITYDGQDHVVQQTTPLGEVTTKVFDAQHNATQITDPIGAVVKNTYDSLQRLTQTERIDATTDRITKCVYNTGNVSPRPNAVIDPSTVQTQFTYATTGAAIGQMATLTKVSAAGNQVATYTYDTTYGLPLGVDTPNPAGGTFHQSFVYSPRGDLTSATDARSFVTSYTYNQNRQKLTVTGPGDSPDYTTAGATYGYDNCGNPFSASDPLGHATQSQHSSTGKILSITVGLLQTGTGTFTSAQAYTNLTNVYDTRDWLVSSTGSIGGQTATTTYDNSGAVKTVTDAAGRTVAFGYDGDGHLTTTSDLADANTSRTITNTYNARGQVTATQDMRGNTLKNTYDAWGDRLTFLNRLGQTFTFGYQTNGLLKNQQTPTGKILSWTYNDRNLVTTNVQPSGHTSTYNYDTADRVSSQVDSVGTISTTYDGNNNRLKVTEGTANLTRTYDPYNRIKTYTDAGGNLVSYHYYANGLLKTVTYPGTPARTVTYAYDNQNRLTQVSDWGSPVRVTTFVWRNDGLLQSIARPNGSTRTMTYDLVGQLVNYQERDPNGNIQTYSHYLYDLGGRITARLELPKPTAVAPVAASLTYDADNRVATYGGTACAFDNDGNMTSGPLPAGGFGTYGYDARNRLTDAGGTTYAYDSENNRIGQTTGGVTTQYVIDPNGGPLSRVLIRKKVDGSQTFYVYGGGILLYEEQVASGATTGTVTYYHFDQVGNTIALTNTAGAIVDRIQYGPYGGINGRLASFDTPFLYSGAQGVMTDANGLVCMRARYYNPRIMRFLNADPIGFAGGSNWYAAFNGNPLSFMDPSGYCAQGGGSSGNSYTSVAGTAFQNNATTPMMSRQDFVSIQSRLPTDTTGDLILSGMQTMTPAPFAYGAVHKDLPGSVEPSLGALGGISYDPYSSSVSNFVIVPEFGIKIPASVPRIGGLEIEVGYEISDEGNHGIIFIGNGTPLGSSTAHGDRADKGIYLSPGAGSAGVYFGGTSGSKSAGGGLGWSLNPLLNAISNWNADHE